MFPRWSLLSPAEEGPYNVAVIFLQDRLEHEEAIGWALRIEPNDKVRKLAVLDVLDHARTPLEEPWLSAWRLIQESWQTGNDTRSHLQSAHIQQCLQAGDRSGVLVSRIVEMVRVTLAVKPGSGAGGKGRRRRRRTLRDVLSVTLSSGPLVDPSELGIATLQDRDFLVELARGLCAEVDRSAAITARLGWDLHRDSWRAGMPRRVYFVPEPDRPANEHEPDEFGRGLASLAKLVHAVISRLSAVDRGQAQRFMALWRGSKNPLHARLWAALACDPDLASPQEVGGFLRACDDEYFWELSSYPEIAELRARRFATLDAADQAPVLKRMMKRPPRRRWPKSLDPAQVDEGRSHWAARELRRIQLAGGELSDRAAEWLAGQLAVFADIRDASRVDFGFRGTHEAQWVAPDPDERYDLLEGATRLEALEAALASGSGGISGGPAERAWDWMRENGHAVTLISDLEATPDAGAGHPLVWDNLGTAQTIAAASPPDGRPALAPRVADLVGRLPDGTIKAAIDGLSQWLSDWAPHLGGAANIAPLWTRLWPFAVELTDAQASGNIGGDLSIVAWSSGDDEPADLDTYNTPAGKMVSAFLRSCPRVEAGDRPFETDASLRGMRDRLIASTGRSGLIMRHRMIESLPWFLMADHQWTTERLLAPLRENSDETLALWRSVARQTQFSNVLVHIGEMMADRALDPRLGRETRKSLVWSLVVESLHALQEARAPAVAVARVQQLLRSIEDELRANAAHALERFLVEGISDGNRDATRRRADALFRQAIRPFLQRVWPQERTLVTEGVASAFVTLPSVCDEAFVEAADAVERFLVPFSCWSLLDFGFERDGAGPTLADIDDEEKCEALLRLLDRSVGSADKAVVPYDLGAALDRIAEVAPDLARSRAFRRLATLARR